MRDRDVEILQRIWPIWANHIRDDVRSIAALSPCPFETNFLMQFFPGIPITGHTIKTWDLNNPASAHYDLIIACGVFMCAADPPKWFQNVFRSCRHFWLLDHILAWRDETKNRECALDDGDCVRYSFPNHPTRVENSFDMSIFANRFDDLMIYPVPPNSHEAKSFIAFLAGDLRMQE